MSFCHSLSIKSESGTEALGHLIATHLPTRSVLLLDGALGAGKTTLARSICLSLGAKPEQFSSPTYTLVNLYDIPSADEEIGTKNAPARYIYHVDLFRVNDPTLLAEWDQDEWINPAGCTLIEWPKQVATLLPDEPCLELTLNITNEITVRNIHLKAHHKAFSSLFDALQAIHQL